MMMANASVVTMWLLVVNLFLLLSFGIVHRCEADAEVAKNVLEDIQESAKQERVEEDGISLSEYKSHHNHHSHAHHHNHKDGKKHHSEHHHKSSSHHHHKNQDDRPHGEADVHRRSKQREHKSVPSFEKDKGKWRKDQDKREDVEDKSLVPNGASIVKKGSKENKPSIEQKSKDRKRPEAFEKEYKRPFQDRRNPPEHYTPAPDSESKYWKKKFSKDQKRKEDSKKEKHPDKPWNEHSVDIAVPVSDQRWQKHREYKDKATKSLQDGVKNEIRERKTLRKQQWKQEKESRYYKH